MAAPAPALELKRTNWWIPWIMLIAGLIIGYFIGRTTTMQAQAKLGDCVRRDSTVVATNVSAQSCQATCATCSWVQGPVN